MEQEKPKQKVGTIYKLTSPSGKEYIGQTIQPFKKRWNSHIGRALNNDEKGCTALYTAIRKYGPENFKTEILLYCNPEHLDMYEQKFINMYNTMYPNGYNLVTGGNSNREVSDIVKEKIRKTRGDDIDKFRTHPESMGLPMYMYYGVRKGVPGYKIERHPNCRQKYFFSSKYTLEEKKQMALEFLQKLNDGLKIETKKQPIKDTPDGIWKHKDGYTARIIMDDGHIIQRSFARPTLSSEENLKTALNFLHKTRETIERNKMEYEDNMSRIFIRPTLETKKDIPIEDCFDDLDLND